MRQRSRFAAIAFDFGGVFQHSYKQVTHGFVASSLGVRLEKVNETFSAAQHDLKRGLVDEAVFWEEYAAAIGGTVPQDWHQLWVGHVASLPVDLDVVDLALELSDAGYQLPLCANTTPWRAEAHAVSGGFDWFSPQVLSCDKDVQCVKPNKCIYDRLVELVDLDPKQMVFVDDKPANVYAAQRLGMEGIVFKSAKLLRHRLEELLIEP